MKMLIPAHGGKWVSVERSSREIVMQFYVCRMNSSGRFVFRETDYVRINPKQLIDALKIEGGE